MLSDVRGLKGGGGEGVSEWSVLDDQSLFFY